MYNSAHLTAPPHMHPWGQVGSTTRKTTLLLGQFGLAYRFIRRQTEMNRGNHHKSINSDYECIIIGLGLSDTVDGLLL